MPKTSSKSGLSLRIFMACFAMLLGVRGLAAVNGVDADIGHLWSQIKDDTYELREHFSSGAAKLTARLDVQIAEMKAKRGGMVTDTIDWDLAFKEVEQSRALLVGRVEALRKATTPDEWSDAKQKVGEAWHRAQLAVDKMNATRSS